MVNKQKLSGAYAPSFHYVNRKMKKTCNKRSNPDGRHDFAYTRQHVMLA
jgi:hypothetical protein